MLAWLHQRPEEAHRCNGERYGLDAPEVEPESEHLARLLDELGHVTHTGMGAAPLSYAEIDAYARLTGLVLTRGEAMGLRMMSAAFAATANIPDAPCPIEDDHARRTIDEVNIRALIRMCEAGDG